MPGLAAIDADLVRTLTSGSTDKIQVYREQMDLSRFGLMGCSVYSETLPSTPTTIYRSRPCTFISTRTTALRWRYCAV
jgi:hypothetical protein